MSLVRSNREKDIGFVRMSDRICVALSRARHCLICIGNMTIMSETSAIWRQIVQTAKSTNSFGTGLKLTCDKKTHAANDIYLNNPSLFDLRPNDGCDMLCEFRQLWSFMLFTVSHV